jgi:hypothetical protein
VLAGSLRFPLDFLSNLMARRAYQLKARLAAVLGVLFYFVADCANRVFTLSTSRAAAADVVENQSPFVSASKSAIVVKPSASSSGASSAEYVACFLF